MASKTSPKIDFILVALGGIVSINLVSILGISFLNLWIRLCSPLLHHPSFLNKALLTIVISVIGLSQSSIVLGLIFSGVEPHWISLLSYSSLGVLILLTTATVFSDLVTCTFGLLNSRSCPSPSRVQYARSQIIAIVIVTALFTALALHNGLKEPLVKQVNIPIKNLPAEFHGFTIVHLPDLHVGPTIGKTMLEKVVKTTNKLNPDAITIAGDLVDATVFQIRQAVKPLLKLRARYGVYFVTGNHEYYTGDVDGWLKELEYLGVTPLHNSHVLLTHPNKNQAKLCLSGVDDSEGGFLRSGNHGTDIIQALKGVDAGTPTILLAHRPKAAKLVLDSHKVDLILTGHTHGGQLFPIHLWHLIREPYFAGLYRHNTGSHVYVSSGVHFWGMPMRLWSEAEITYIVLISSEK